MTGKTKEKPLEETSQAVQVRAPNSIDDLISQAVANKTPVETMERLFNLRKEVKAEVAKEAFVKAVADFQDECPVIEKKKKVTGKEGKLRYMFAPLDSIVEQIKKPLKNAGLSYRWETGNEEKAVNAICIVTHALGHSEQSSFSVPIDPEGYMSAPQRYAAALTFAKRYSLCNVLGISTADEDTDATTVNKEASPTSIRSKIMFCLRELDYNTETKEEIAETVVTLTALKLEEKNFSAILKKLETLVVQKNAKL